MASQVLIVDSEKSHAEELTKSLRESDRLEAIRIGLDPDTAVLHSYSYGLYRKTGLIDSKVAAMWGVMGTPTGITGCPYLITGSEIYNISPMRFAKIYMKELKVMRSLFPVLESYVDAEYKDAIRMLSLAGCKLEGSILINNNYFLKFR